MRAYVRSSMALLLAVVAACGSPTEPEAGLEAGTYRASFTVPLDDDTPGPLIGDHDFPFRVGEPSRASSFELASSRHLSRTLDGEPTQWEAGSLSSSTDRVIAGGTPWRVQWEYAGHISLAVNVTLVEKDGGGHSVEFCRGVRDPPENYAGHSCEVERVD